MPMYERVRMEYRRSPVPANVGQSGSASHDVTPPVTDAATDPDAIAEDGQALGEASAVPPGMEHAFSGLSLFAPTFAGTDPDESRLTVIQRTADDGDTAPDPDLAWRIRAATGTGRGIDGETRGQLEHGIGADLARVRVHTDTDADQFARSVDAAAFTTGQDIFFRAGTYNPQSRVGMHLLAHEAAHTVQQAAGPVAATPTADGLAISDPGDPFEQAAGRTADAVVGMGESTNGAAARSPLPRVGPVDGGGERGLLIQRAPQTATDKRLDNLERDQRILKKRTDALEQDNRWRSMFMERISSYKQAILRITGGMDAAEKGFQAAQVAQAQFDQLKVQLIGAAGTFVFAAGFEWAVSSGLGKLGVNATRISKIVEQWENPANALASSGVNIAGSVTAQKDAQAGQTPSLSGGSIQFLTSNSEALEHHVQSLEAAFSARANKMKGATDEEWDAFDLNVQESLYQQLFNNMKDSASGVESLKDANQIGRVIERHLWALWLTGQQKAELDAKQATIEAGNPIDLDPTKSAPDFSVGSYIEDELNACGVATFAGVRLSGHWFVPNSSDWLEKLVEWARGYGEQLTNEGGK
jgi:hypothetical protein